MTGMQVNLTGSGLLKLFRQVGHLARRGSDQQLALGKLTEALGWYFGLDRCMALLVNPDSQELELVADFAREPLTPLGAKRYHLRLNSEWQQLLAERKPLPLKDIRPDRGEPSAMPELDQFVNDSGSQSMVCFPLVHPGQLLGCLLMAHCRETRGFSDEFLELGRRSPRSWPRASSSPAPHASGRWKVWYSGSCRCRSWWWALSRIASSRRTEPL